MKYILLLSLLLAACSSYEVTPNGRTVQTTPEYGDIIEKNSDKVRRYSGLYNTLDIEGTLLNSEVIAAQLAQNTQLYQWDDTRLKDEKAKFENKLSKETEIFLSFFTPERKNDDLFKKDTIWKIFLDVDGKRYEGKAIKIRTQLAEIIGLYPYHNRFYTPYSVIFPVPLKTIEGKEAKVTLTGVVGSGVLTFKN